MDKWGGGAKSKALIDCESIIAELSMVICRSSRLIHLPVLGLQSNYRPNKVHYCGIYLYHSYKLECFHGL